MHGEREDHAKVGHGVPLGAHGAPVADPETSDGGGGKKDEI